MVVRANEICEACNSEKICTTWVKVDRKIFVQKNCPLTPSKGYWSICNKVWIFYQVWDHSFVFSYLIFKYNTPGLLPGIKINSELFALTEPSLANGVANGYLTICTVTKQYRRNNFLQLKKFLHAHWLIFIVNKQTDTWIINVRVNCKKKLASVFKHLFC